ncbi:ead/Ea22-like family protein [Pseudomonas putida]
MSVDTKKLKALAEAATKGDWRYGPGDDEDENPIVFVDLPQASGVAISILFESDWATDTDAAFVAKASPKAVIALIDEIDQLKVQNEELKQNVYYSDQIIETRTRLLKSIPPCPVHGDECVPHAMEWVASALAKERGQ